MILADFWLSLLDEDEDEDEEGLFELDEDDIFELDTELDEDDTFKLDVELDEDGIFELNVDEMLEFDEELDVRLPVEELLLALDMALLVIPDADDLMLELCRLIDELANELVKKTGTLGSASVRTLSAGDFSDRFPAVSIAVIVYW